jgi:hypothetical protein
MSTPTGPAGYPGDSQQQQPPSPYPQQGYVDPQLHGGQTAGHTSGPGMGERFQQAGDTVARHVKTPETKEFFKTSEFLVWAITTLGILISAAVVTEGNGHDFAANQAWLYVAIASAAYIISRGLAKAGTRRGYGDAPFDRGGGAPFQRGGGY